MKSWRSASALVVAASVATLISGCGGPKESPAAGNAPAAAEVAPAARKEITLAKGWKMEDAITAEEVGAITGETMTYFPEANSNAAEGRPSAGYTVAGKDFSKIAFYAYVNGGEKEFESTKSYATPGSVVEVPGIGDKAYMCDFVTGATVILVLHGQDVIKVDWQPKTYEKFEKVEFGKKLAGKLLEKMYK